MLSSIARLCHRFRRTTLLVWLIGSLLLVTVGGMAKPAFDAEYALPDTDSQRAYTLLEQHFPEQATGRGEIVLHAPAGLDTPAVRSRADQVLRAARESDPAAVRTVVPFGDAERGGRVSEDGRTGVAVIVFDAPRTEVPKAVAKKIEQRLTAMSSDSLRVELSGSMFAPVPSTGLSETVGLVAAVVILLFAFGSLALAAVPVVAALVALFTAMGLVMLLTKVMSVPNFSMSVAVMIVLGVGVDYALFIATRYRTARRAGQTPPEAVAVTAATSGRAVLFAGTTVIVSLGGMLFMGIPFVYGLAVSCALGVLATLALGLTLVPALLGLCDRWITRAGRPERRPAAATPFQRNALARHGGKVACATVAVLLAMCAPAFSMRLGTADAGNAPATETTRRAYDLKQQAFGPGSTAALSVVADLRGADAHTLTRVTDRLRATAGVAAVAPPALSRDGRAALLTVVPTTTAQQEETARLVRTLRGDVLPAAQDGTPMRLHVGGLTATSLDLTRRMADRLLIFVLAVVVISLLLLSAMFKSVLVPLQAIALTLLALGASYGLLTAVFQWGWGAALVGAGSTGPLESYMPMTLMALLFGLSMDYQVFVLSRIREALSRTGDARAAVAEGLRSSARVVAAAALIMAAVFAAFVLSPDRIMKQFGLGLATAVLVEAFLVLAVTPVILTRLGDRAWLRHRSAYGDPDKTEKTGNHHDE
ncbi:MMPL family transporter [Streptomyces gamaensis]|uniref:MMPL family transporter n=1 Tax=Streptomyces gamaensis TaxID=1763542 RepID=A0ABW0YTC0_9ACTN